MRGTFRKKISAVATEADDALLNPRAAAVVQADHRCADLHSRVHDLDDLVGVHLPQAFRRRR